MGKKAFFREVFPMDRLHRQITLRAQWPNKKNIDLNIFPLPEESALVLLLL